MSRAYKHINRFAKKIIFDERRDKYEILSTQKLLVTLVAIFVFMLLYSAYFSVVAPYDYLKHFTNALGVILVAGGIYFLKKNQNKNLVIFIFNLLTSALIFTSLMNSGGIYSIDIEWFLFSSICSFLFVSIRLGILMSIINIILVLILYYLELSDFKDFKSDSIKTDGLHEFFTFIFIQVIYATVLYFFIRILTNTRKELDTITRQKIEELNELVEKRTQENLSLRNDIAKDFHDVMGNKLASISSLSQMLHIKKHLSEHELKHELVRINKLSKEVYDGTKDFIWALNIQRNNVFYAYLYLKDFAERLYQNTDIDFISEPIDEDLENMKLPTFWTSQFILIMKEAMTNALVHSKAQSVTLQVVKHEKFLEVSLTDNGTGFSIDDLPRINGLENMKSRAIKINADLKIESEKNIQTRVSLKFNL